MSDNILQLREQDGLQAAISPEPILEAADITFTFSYDQENDEGIPHLHASEEDPTRLQPLTAEEQQLLEKCEKEIDEEMAGFYAVGRCLAIIKTKKLYRAKYKTFTDYCDKEWNISRVHANRQIEASQTIDDLKSEPIGSVPLPKNEAQARMLATLTKEQKIAVAKHVKQSATDDAPTAKDWEEAKETIAPKHTDTPKTEKAAKTNNPQPANIKSLPASEHAVENLLDKLDEAEAIARKNGFTKTIVHIRAAVVSLNKEKQELKMAA